MKRAFLADAQPDERLAFRLILQDLGLQVVGEAADWASVLALAPKSRPDMLMVDWGLVASASGANLADLRLACPAALVIVLFRHLTAREQAALSAGADTFISKGETSDQVAERVRDAVGSIHSKGNHLLL